MNQIQNDFNYTWKMFIGKGSFGEVNLYEDNNSKEVVIKSISYEAAGQKSFEFALKEISILCQLNHPRIISFIQFFQFAEKNTINLIMEYASGGNLADELSYRKKLNTFMTQFEVLKYFCDILMGVNYLHLKKVLHRDLKTENILIGEDGRIKIADFSISKTVTEYCNLDGMGTPNYLAPELFRREEYTELCDVWSIGVIFYEMCTLNYPFVANCVDDLYHKITKTCFAPINCELLGFNYHFTTLAGLMLQPIAERRYSIDAIICYPLIMKEFYESFFEYSNIRF